MSDATISEASAAVVWSKSAVARPVIRVSLLSVRARCGLISLPSSSLRLTDNLLLSG